MSFIYRFESYFPSLQKVYDFRESQVYTNFLSRWNLPVYFQFRFKKIVSEISETMKNGQEISSPDSKRKNGKPIFEVTSICIQSIQNIWESYFLYPLGHRFCQLTLQIIERYYYWIQKEFCIKLL